MSCYTRLVESHFLRNVEAEFSLAQEALKSQLPFDEAIVGLNFNRNYNKALYEFYISMLNCVEDLEMALQDEHMVNYIQDEYIILLFSCKKNLVQEALLYTHHINGDVSFFQSRHRVKNKYVYTAMIDTRFIIPPCTTN